MGHIFPNNPRLRLELFFLSHDPEEAAGIFHNKLMRLLDISSFVQASQRSKSQTEKISDKLSKLQRRYQATNDFFCLLRSISLSSTLTSVEFDRLYSEEQKATVSTNKTVSLMKLMRQRSPREADTVSFLTSHDGTTLNKPLDIAEEFLQFSSTTFNTQDHIIPYSPYPEADPLLSNITPDVSTIKLILATIRPTYMPDALGLPPALFKYGGPDIPLLLLNIFSLSLSSGVFFTSWKHSLIRPRHKAGLRHLVSNYRPINHTPQISRILENVVKFHLLKYLPRPISVEINTGSSADGLALPATLSSSILYPPNWTSTWPLQSTF